MFSRSKVDDVLARRSWLPRKDSNERWSSDVAPFQAWARLTGRRKLAGSRPANRCPAVSPSVGSISSPPYREVPATVVGTAETRHPTYLTHSTHATQTTQCTHSAR